VPSSQQPPAGATALDPTALRSDLGDARPIRITPAELRATLERLRNEGFALLLDIGGVDYLGREPRFDVVYHLVKVSVAARTIEAIGRPERVRVLCGVAGSEPEVPSVVDLWPSADWAEREIFDLFGIRFAGHPDLRRIQMPADWTGHPFRGPAQERSPRPSFALKSNVAAGTPAAGRTAAALQRQIAAARGQEQK
jgi:NADH-quinone oxidoreductase subunit C